MRWRPTHGRPGGGGDGIGRHQAGDVAARTTLRARGAGPARQEIGGAMRWRPTHGRLCGCGAGVHSDFVCYSDLFCHSE